MAKSGPDHAAGHAPAHSPLAIRLFGPFEVRLHDAPLPRLHSRKGEWLLALLTLRHGAEVARAWLAGTLWPDSPESRAFANLRNTLTDLRRALGQEAHRLRSPTPHTLSLELAGAEVDVVAFDLGIAQGDPAALVRAIALHQRALLEGCEEEWVFQERQRREQAYLQALETLAAASLERGEVGAAECLLRRAVGLDPLRERTQRGLMQALASGGNYAAAMEVYRELRLLLHRELNAQPAPETQALFEQLRAQARRLARSEPPAPPASAPAVAPPFALLPEGTVTFLFTDIEGSTRLWEQHPEPMRLALARHHSLVSQGIEEHGGSVITRQGEGDSYFAVFARAADAVAAACSLQRELQAERWPTETPVRVRMALHTGEADLRDGDYFGVAVNRCARLRGVGHGGQTLLSQTTAALVRDHLPEGMSPGDLGTHRLKDLQRPERVFQLLHPDLPQGFPPLRTLDLRPNNLPAQPNPLVGREREVTAVLDLLRRQAVRLVTLIGPGGTGKTRLGLQVAADLIDEFENGVFLVELAPLTDPGLVASTIAQTLGVPKIGSTPRLESLKQSLRDQQMLLVLDNFEQLLPAAPLLAELLAAAPGLKLVVTSRAVLNVRGEHAFPVPPLALPDRDHPPAVEALSQYAAVELFLQRATAATADFAVTGDNAPAIVEICHRLEGLPLALELAAARIRLLPPEALLSRLQSRLKLLTGGARDLPARQQTLRNTISWGYELLAAEEQKLFRRLAVFVGGFTLEAAEGVCDPDGDLGIDVLDGMASLVDKSLLQQEPRPLAPLAAPARAAAGDDEARFRMFETIREYGLERLCESGEAETVRQQHASFFTDWGKRISPGLIGADQKTALDRVEREHDNVRAALEWCLQRGAAQQGLRLGNAVYRLWAYRGYLSEGREWIARLLASPEAVAYPRERAASLTEAGYLANWQSDYDAARRLCEESLAIARELGDQELMVNALLGAQCAAWGQRDLKAARSFVEESQALSTDLSGRRDIPTRIAYHRGLIAFSQGDYETARSDYRETLELAPAAGHRMQMGRALRGLGSVARAQWDLKAARALYEKSLALSRELGIKGDVAWTLDAVGEVARQQGHFEEARAWFEESLALRRKLGDKQNTARLLLKLAEIAQLLGDGREWFAWPLSSAGGFFCEVCPSPQEAPGAGDRRGATALYAESLALWRELGHKPGVAACLEGLGVLAEREGQAERAARLFGAAAELRQPIGAGESRPAATTARRFGGRARIGLGEEAFTTAWKEGQAMSLEDVVTYARQDGSEGAVNPCDNPPC